MASVARHQYTEVWSRSGGFYSDLSCADISPDGDNLAAGSGNTLIIGSLSDGREQLALTGNGRVSAVRWAQTPLKLGHYRPTLVCGFEDGLVVAVSILATHYQILGFQGYIGQPLVHLDLSCDGQRLTTGSKTHLWTWNFVHGDWKPLASWHAVPQQVEDATEVEITSLCTVPGDPHLLLVAYQANGVFVWDIAQQVSLRSIVVSPNPIGRVVMSPQGDSLAVVRSSGVVIYDFLSGQMVSKASTTTGVSSPVAFIHNGKGLLGTYNTDRGAWWRTDLREQTAPLGTFKHPESPLTGVAGFESNATGFLVLTVSQNVIRLWGSDPTLFVTYATQRTAKEPYRTLIYTSFIMIAVAAVVVAFVTAYLSK
ncbi:hypothetical protein EIP91_011206 [Steccherinum ochraceum]|uniref:Uncharacterized protein n=1 Tax=Steccherinum ochraceum TaxID=92696 RepID=A0A4R0QZX4_9APHY|nr:hypothetical protein EIP91_011206 [Steccherinum ochraceum]